MVALTLERESLVLDRYMYQVSHMYSSKLELIITIVLC